MRLGAVIAAAGMSSRMGAFKPLLKINGVPAAERVVRRFREAGVSRIIAVTGNNAEALERALEGLDVTFVRNERYADTDMFHSVKLGLERAAGECGKVFIIPADVSVFTSGTVMRLKNCSSEVVMPEYNGKTGHPVMLSYEAVGRILAYEGDGGLKGAIASLQAEPERLAVNDPGVLMDMDTPAAYADMVKYAESGLKEGNGFEAY